MKMQNKAIVVTGAGSGIGRALTLRLVAVGAQVAAVDLNADSLAETVNLAGPRKDKVSPHVVNVSDKAAVEALPQAVIDAHGAVDGLINNAGIIQPFVRLRDLDYAAIERVLNVNLYGVIYMTKAFLPHLLDRPVAHIANVSSMGGFFPVPGQTMYGASKAAVKLLTEGLYAELIDTNVGVTVIFPGAIATNITANSGVDTPAAAAELENASPMRATSAEDAAQAIIDGIERHKFQVYVGNDAKLMNFFYRLSPLRATRFMYNQMKGLLANS